MSYKPEMGRSRLPPEELKRHKLTIYITDRHFDILNGKAQECEMTHLAYLRKMIEDMEKGEK